MASSVNPGLLLRTCTTKVFNKIKDKSDTTLYFVTPDINNDIAGVTNMQAVTLYRGENIVEDSNVIFVRDYNLPTQIDKDTETIYYRHHCMESHAQSLTSTITGTPGQKLYVLFIDSSQNSPTYNQIIDAFMYIWQTDIAVLENTQFTAKIESTLSCNDINEAFLDNREWVPYTGELNGVWTIHHIDSYNSADGTFTGLLTCKDSRLGINGALKLELSDITPGTKISEHYEETAPFTCISTTDTVGASIVLKHAPLVSCTGVKIHSAENVTGVDEIIYETNGTDIVYNGVKYGEIDYSTGLLTFTSPSRTGMSPTEFVINGITSITYDAVSSKAALGITRTITENTEGEIVPDIFTLYIGTNKDAKSVLEEDHDVITGNNDNGCWLGFCIKNDTTDLFSIANAVYRELKQVEHKLDEHHYSIQEHRSIYQDTKIVYKTKEPALDADGNIILDIPTGKPLLNTTATVIVDGENGEIAIKGNTGTQRITNEYLTDDDSTSIDIADKGKIVPGSISMRYFSLDGQSVSITDKDLQGYYKDTIYNEPINLLRETHQVSGNQSTVSYKYFIQLKNSSISRGSLYLILDINSDSPQLKLKDDYIANDTIGQLVSATEDTKFSFGTVDYATGLIDITALCNSYQIEALVGSATYEAFLLNNNKGTLLAEDNTEWGFVDYSDGTLYGHIVDVIASDTSSSTDKVVVSYDYIPHELAGTESVYFRTALEKTTFYNDRHVTYDDNGNIVEIKEDPAKTTISNEGNIHTAGTITSNSHYPNDSNKHDIGLSDRRWNSIYGVSADLSAITRTPTLKVSNITTYIDNGTIVIGQPSVDDTESTKASNINIIAETNIEATAKFGILDLHANKDIDVKSTTSNITLNAAATGGIIARDINITSSNSTKLESGSHIELNTPSYLLHTNTTNIQDANDTSVTFYGNNGVVITHKDTETGKILSTSHIPHENNEFTIGTSEYRWKALYSTEAYLNKLYIDRLQAQTEQKIYFDSDIATYNITPQTTGTYSIGTSTTYFNELHGSNLYINNIRPLADATTVYITAEFTDIADNAVIGGNLDVSGDTTTSKLLASNNIETAADLAVAGNTVITGSAEIKHGLLVTAPDITYSDTDTAITANGNVIVSKKLYADTISVTDAAEIGGNATISGELYAYSSENLSTPIDSAKAVVIVGNDTDNYEETRTLYALDNKITGAAEDLVENGILTLNSIKNYTDKTKSELSQVFYIDEPLSDSDVESIIAYLDTIGITPVESNIVVVRRVIATDTNGTEGDSDDIVRYSYTGYVYTAIENTYTVTDDDGNTVEVTDILYDWIPMTGMYSAENVYLTKDFKFTGPVGTVTQTEIDDNRGYTSRRAAGRSIQDFLYDLFAQSKAPIIVDPTYSIKASAILDIDAEVGNYITGLKWDGTFTSGSYEYGSVESTDNGTGITATYKVTNNINDAESTVIDSTFELNTDSKIQIDSTSSKTYAQVTGVCSYIESPRTPINNLHDPVPSEKITAGEITKTANITVTGHRKMFYGSSDSVLTLDSDIIRTSLQGKSISSTSSISVPIVANASHVVIALPIGRVLKTLVNPDSKIDLMTVVGAVTKSTINVEGANGFTSIEYNVYEYKPAAALGANTYTATIANG